MTAAVWYGSAFAVAVASPYLFIAIGRAHRESVDQSLLYWLGCFFGIILVPWFFRRVVREKALIDLYLAPAMLAVVVVAIVFRTNASVVAVYVVAVVTIWAIAAAFNAFEEDENESITDRRKRLTAFLAILALSGLMGSSVLLVFME